MSDDVTGPCWAQRFWAFRGAKLRFYWGSKSFEVIVNDRDGFFSALNLSPGPNSLTISRISIFSESGYEEGRFPSPIEGLKSVGLSEEEALEFFKERVLEYRAVYRSPDDIALFFDLRRRRDE